MKYRDFNGKFVEIDTFQDKLLRCIYGCFVGRVVLKAITLPAVSKIAGKFLDSKMSCMFISPFIKHNNIDLKEYKCKHYKSYNDFFTREIKPEKRPIDQDDNHLISPADGNVMIYPIRRSSHFMVKNTIYTLRSILQNKNLACRYHNGYCIVIRLCVDNYHRYCYIDNCTKSANVHIKGKLHTVNPIANDFFPIYKENSREYTILHTEHFGDVVQIEVGALMVGKITNLHKFSKGQENFSKGQENFSKGQEKGFFEFGGSTIMMLIKSDADIQFRQDIIENSILGIETKIKMGECIGWREV
ncbi:MAG: phosphatidylserine decarboxylase [Lachnospiraceae bacterium]|nr:phosphatidylserine decarboxylase [Lachnospiraceae bacterium]